MSSAIPDIADLDVDPPAAAPETCPLCGEPYDDLLPPGLGADVGDHDRQCTIGRGDDTPLAGWRVIHR